jgi:two-component sensor histidine kinase
MTPPERRGHAILAERRTPPLGLFWAAIAVVVPAVVKLALDGWLRDVPPFLTYFPAITLAALFLGWRWGTACLIASALICDYLFMAPYRTWSLSTNGAVVLVLYLISGGVIVATAGVLRASMKRVQAASAREHELNFELKHRVNNNLAIVQAITKQGARAQAAPLEFYASLSQRLDALREAHDVLSSTDWVSCDLPRLVERALKGFLPSPAIRIEGAPCTLPPGSCVPIALAIHELGANATKHGALSAPEGRVDVSWQVEGRRLVLQWVERNGPTVSAPTRTGLGARLLATQHGLDQVLLEYPTEGVRCTITIEGAST